MDSRVFLKSRKRGIVGKESKKGSARGDLMGGKLNVRVHEGMKEIL